MPDTLHFDFEQGDSSTFRNLEKVANKIISNTALKIIILEDEENRLAGSASKSRKLAGSHTLATNDIRYVYACTTSARTTISFL